MCNQFRLPTLAEIRKYLKNELDLPLSEPKFKAPTTENIFPNDLAPVLLYQNQQLQLVLKKWGYLSPVDAKKTIFNARIERFYQERPSMWDHSFAKQRCLIIAKEFWESGRATYQAENGHTYHDRYAFKNPNQPLTLIAGIYDHDHFAMVTTSPNAIMKPIHNRMPLVIAPDELRRWLFQNFTSLIDRDKFTLQVSKQKRKI